ncbi:MAG: prepilin-type N-terminal cleavage/methylation domain-containing protein [Ferrovum sp.]|nr:prepilin-type N-terminal cleavage/methylation domain-containing protein [Ferrovum sp.]
MRGFTLVEVMVVALLVSLMAIMSWRVLESLTRTQTILKSRGDALEETQYFFNQWRHDCQGLLPPDQWRDGPPVQIGENQIAWLVQAEDGVHRIGYVYAGGGLKRLDRGPFQNRGDWEADWQALVQGGELTGKVGELTVPGSIGLQARVWSDTGWATAVATAPGTLIRGMELAIPLAGTEIPLRQVCLTGQD